MRTDKEKDWREWKRCERDVRRMNIRNEKIIKQRRVMFAKMQIVTHKSSLQSSANQFV